MLIAAVIRPSPPAAATPFCAGRCLSSSASAPAVTAALRDSSRQPATRRSPSASGRMHVDTRRKAAFASEPRYRSRTRQPYASHRHHAQDKASDMRQQHSSQHELRQKPLRAEESHRMGAEEVLRRGEEDMQADEPVSSVSVHALQTPPRPSAFMPVPPASDLHARTIKKIDIYVDSAVIPRI